MKADRHNQSVSDLGYLLLRTLCNHNRDARSMLWSNETTMSKLYQHADTCESR